MKKYHLVYILGLIGLNALSQTPANDPHWILDEHWNFKTMSSTTLNQEWIIAPCIKALDHGSAYVERQSYRGANVTISSAGLKLTVKQQTLTDKVYCYLPDSILLSDGYTNLRPTYYTSGYVASFDSLKYGYIESRMRVPYGHDFFPAFWTFRTTNAAATASEIDIFEMLPAENYPYNHDVAKTNVHLCYDCGDAIRNEDINMSSSYMNYHTYGVEWSPTKIIWYFDNVAVRVMANPGVHDYTTTIINMALNPFVPANPSLTNYPQSMDIDYVKWYKLDNSTCNVVVNDYTFNFSGYQETVKKSITIGDVGSTNTQPASSSTFLRATDFVQLNGTFTVPLGSELFIDVNACY